MKPISETLLRIDQEFTKQELVQIIELTVHKLDLKTISNYSRCNNISYNGAKNHREHVEVNGVKFVCEGIKGDNLPF